MEGGNGHRNYFMVNLHESYVAGLGLNLTNTDCASEPGGPREKKKTLRTANTVITSVHA